MTVDEQAVAEVLRAAGARFGFVHGSRADGQPTRRVRNALVHQYAEVDDRRTLEHLQHLDDLDGFRTSIARWLRDA